MAVSTQMRLGDWAVKYLGPPKRNLGDLKEFIVCCACGCSETDGTFDDDIMSRKLSAELERGHYHILNRYFNSNFSQSNFKFTVCLVWSLVICRFIYRYHHLSNHIFIFHIKFHREDLNPLICS